MIGDDFTGLQLHDDETRKSFLQYSFLFLKCTAAPPQRLNRPLVNPDLFKSSSERKVSFQESRQDTNDLYDASPDPTKRPASTGSRSKWQPLAAVDPDPVQEHDPFSLGDSDEEESKKKDLKPEDSERLKQATAEAMADTIGADQKEELAPTETSGTQDKLAQEKLVKQ